MKNGSSLFGKLIGGALLAGAGATIGRFALQNVTQQLFDYAVPRKIKYGKLTHALMDKNMVVSPEKQAYQDKLDAGKDWFFAQDREKVEIHSYDGLTLRGSYLPAEQDAGKRILLMMHGFRASTLFDLGCMFQFGHELGYDLMVPFERAHGESDGEYISYGVKERFDVQNWCRYLTQRFGEDCEIVLFGVSMGAATVLMSTGLNLPKSVKGVIADCGFTSPMEEFRHIFEDGGVPSFLQKLLLRSTEKMCRTEAGFAFDEYSTFVAMKTNQLPIFFIHGTADTFVPTIMSVENYEACKTYKKLWLVEGAEHACSSAVATEAYHQNVIEFLREIGLYAGPGKEDK